MDSKSGDVFWKSGSRHTEEADAVAAVSVYRRQRSGLGGVGTTRAAARGAEFRHASGHDQSSNTGTQPTRSRMAQERRTERDEAAGERCSQKALHEAYRQWCLADGSDFTPMEVDALTKGKGKSKS